MSETTTAPKTGQVLVTGNRRWGAGDTLAEARKNWQRQGGRISDGYTIVTFDDATEFHGVDQMGGYSYVGNAPTVETVSARKR